MRAILAQAAVLILAWSLLACTDDGADSARARYNQAVEDYAAGRLDQAAEGFLDARDRAGVDPDLRFRSAFNLGLTYARQADAAGAAPGPNAAPEAAAPEGADAPAGGPEAAMNSLRQSAAWFRDAVRLDPENEDARVNLEVVLRRIQILADQLNQGQNSLEARLGRVIEDQRALRDQIRELMQRVAESGAEAEPVAFEGEFDTLATFERRLMADTGTVSDLAGEELDLLRNKEQRTEEEEVRVVQLGNLDGYLQTARGELADTRRLLRRLSGDKAHRRSDVALAALKRAQEQLLDPVTVLRGIAEDQVQLLGHTVGLDQLGKASIQIGAGPEDDQGGQAAPASAPAAPPAWLTTEHLRERQDILKQRTDEVLARFQAGVTAAGEQPGQEPGQEPGPSAQDPAAPAAGAPDDPRQKRMLAQAADAIPFLQQAVGHMDAAAQALAGAAPGQGLAEIGETQGKALEALLRAIERFSDIRGLIELVYRDHAMTSALLTPPDAPEAAALPPELAALPTDERVSRIQALVGQNLDRLTRLGGLFEDEVSVLDAQAAQAAQGQAAPAPGQGQAPSPEQIEAARQQYLQAQGLRSQAEDALTRLRTAMAAGNAAGVTEARAASAQAMEHIEALRRLFFSIVEHLKELLQSQTNTHDQTGSAAAGPDEELASRLGTLAEPQGQHAATGDALAQALAEQSDAAAQSPQAPQTPGAPGGADAAKQLAEAAQEVTQASGEMHGAADFLRKDADAAQTSSVDISPTLQAQQRAMEHLQNAIRLLEPPQEDQQQEQQEQQDQQQQQQQEEQQAQEMSQSQAQRRLQEIRDREAERRRQQQPFKPEPVEKDW
jgi:hypothetical protein